MMAKALLLLFLSASKLGTHILGDAQDSSTHRLLSACPPIVKWLTPINGEIESEISFYKNLCPYGIVVIRPYVPPTRTYSISDSASCSADDFWVRMQPGLNGVRAERVDWVEGPNEIEMLPPWTHDLAAVSWYGQFWSRLADRMAGAGYHPLVGSISVGNPALAGESPGCGFNCFRPIADALRSKPYRWGWSYHGYSRDLSPQVSQEIWYSLRYRLIRDQANLAGIPIVISETGQDIPTGWQGRGVTPAQYFNWLRIYDGWLQQDADVVGATIFESGDRGQWANFDIRPIADMLMQYWNPTACH